MVGSFVLLVSKDVLWLFVGSQSLGSLVIEENSAGRVLLISQLSEPLVVDDSVSVLGHGEVVVVLLVLEGELERLDLDSSGGLLVFDGNSSQGPKLVGFLVTLSPDSLGILELLQIGRTKAKFVVLQPVTLSLHMLVLSFCSLELSEFSWSLLTRLGWLAGGENKSWHLEVSDGLGSLVVGEDRSPALGAVGHSGLVDSVSQLLVREDDVSLLVLVVVDSEELLLHSLLWLLEVH